MERAAAPLSDAPAVTRVASGDFKPFLLAAADDGQTDSIFVAAASAGHRWDLDETAASLITGAKCTVEIVR